MTPDGFLSVLSIGVAVYALMSPVQKMRARLSLHVQIVLAIGFLIAVLYLELFETLKLPCMLKGWCEALVLERPRAPAAQQVAFLLVLAWLVSAFVVHHKTRPWASALSTIAEIVDTLMAERKLDDLISFIEPHIRFLRIAAERRFVIQRLYDTLDGWAPDDPRAVFRTLPPAGPRRKVSGPVLTQVKGLVGSLKRIVPSERHYEQRGTDILRRIYRSDELRAIFTKFRPYSMLPLLSVALSEKHDFCEAVFRDLVADRTSVFYQEMKVGLALSWTQGFVLDPANQLQSYLFKDCRVAEALSIWQPVGNYIDELLAGQHSADYVQKLNGPKTNPSIDRDPALTTIIFFDLMVRRAAFQNVNNHMWLMYLDDFVATIQSVTKVPVSDDETYVEFPTLGMYVIYEIFNTLGSWVQMVRSLPAGSLHLNFGGDRLASIPVHAAGSLGRALKCVLESMHLPDAFKSYMLEVVMRDIKALRNEGISGQARAMLVSRIVGGGEAERDANFAELIDAFLPSIDYVLRSDVEDFVEAVKEAA